MNDLTRRALIAGMGVTAGAAVWPGAMTGASPRQTTPGGLVSTSLHYTSLPAIAFRPADASPYTAANGGITGTGEFLAPLSPAVGDALRELDVVVESAAQPGTVTLTRYPLYSAGAPEVLGSGTYAAVPGRQTVVILLEHIADPLMFTYVVSVTLTTGVVLHGGNLWFFPLGAGLVIVPPQRAYDSRTSDGKIASGQTRTIELPLGPNTPSALINLTLDQTEDRGFLTAFASLGEDGSGPPGTSSINWDGPDQIRANLVITRLGGEHGNAVSILAGGPGRTHFIIDVLGYFT